MNSILELSIFFLFTGSLLNPLFSWAQAPLKTAKKSEILAATDLPGLAFLEQAEDIEREAWWVITRQRQGGLSSPFKVLRAASFVKQQKIPFQFEYCKLLLVANQGPSVWRIESQCQKPSKEIGLVQKLSSQPEKWKISWKTSQFQEHFGFSTSILYNQQSCEIELNSKKIISKMSCPQYVRDRKENEIVLFRVFEYNATSSRIIKLEGEVKKELQVIATFKTEVPLSGDIILNVKKIEHKPIEESDTKNEEKSSEKSKEKSQYEKNYEEVRKANPEEAPPIEDEKHEEIPLPSR